MLFCACVSTWEMCACQGGFRVFSGGGNGSVFVQYIIALSMRCVEDYANRKIRQRSHLKKESYKKRSCMEVNIVYGRYSQSIHWRMNSTLKHCDNVEFAYIVHRTGPFPASWVVVPPIFIIFVPLHAVNVSRGSELKGQHSVNSTWLLETSVCLPINRAVSRHPSCLQLFFRVMSHPLWNVSIDFYRDEWGPSESICLFQKVRDKGQWVI